VCGATPIDTFTEIYLDFGKSQTCASSKPFTYIEHTAPGSSRRQAGSGTYEFDWTPPATNVGDINVYVAGNAANGDANNTFDHIYTNKYTLTAAAGGGPTPAIATDGVQNGASFTSGMAPNSWITIKGSNLSSATDTWDKAIVNGVLPTSLDNVSVSVGGKPAYVYFVSPGQINVIAPDVGTGSMPVTVTNAGATSATFTTNSTPVSPAFFIASGVYPVATRVDNSLVIKNGTFPGTTTVAAKPGETIILWGTGFGPTSPAVPVGKATPSDQLYFSASPVTMTVGGAPATVVYALLAPTLASVYQVAVTIPANAPDGDLPIVASVAGAQSPSTVLVTVQH
jgi:uncharacterized protein (TIGR03437 family)